MTRFYYPLEHTRPNNVCIRRTDLIIRKIRDLYINYDINREQFYKFMSMINSKDVQIRELCIIIINKLYKDAVRL